MELLIGFVVVIAVIIFLCIQYGNKKADERRSIIDFIYSYDGIDLAALVWNSDRESGTSIQREGTWEKKYALRDIKWIGFIKDIHHDRNSDLIVELESYYYDLGFTSVDRYWSSSTAYNKIRIILRLRDDNQVAKFKDLGRRTCVRYKGTLPKKITEKIEIKLENGELLEVIKDMPIYKFTNLFRD